MAAIMTPSTQTNAATDNGSTSQNNKTTSSQDIGLIFVREYYTFLNKSPHRMHAFYSNDSIMVRGDESQEHAPTLVGREAIRRKFEQINFSDCRVLITQVDSQRSANGGILVQVLGEMCNGDGPVQKFSQTFFLAPQPNGYYVLNDIFRFLKDVFNTDLDTFEKQGKNDTQLVTSETPSDTEPSKVNATDNTAVTTASTSAAEPASAPESPRDQDSESKPANAEPTPPTSKQPDEDSKSKQRSKSTKADGPKTWALLAAGNETASRKTPSSASSAPSAPDVSNVSETDGKESPRPNHAAPHSHAQRRNSSQTRNNKEFTHKEDVDIFIKNVSKTITMEQLKEAFTAQFGEVENVTVVYPKNCAFLQFVSPESCQKALAQNKVTVGDTVVLAEERRPNGYRRPQPNGSNTERRFPSSSHRRGGGGQRGGAKPRGGGAPKH